MVPVIGIDLGTTNCCVAVLSGFASTVISNRQGYKTTPSILAITEDGDRLVGQRAARQQVTNPEHTVYGTKRLLGRRWESREVQHAKKHAPFDIVEGPHDDVRVVIRDRQHSIPELAAMLLQEMRVIAEEYLGEPVDRAVVTVPAYFNESQRQAVRDAGLIAGLDVIRILNEPTSAALAYGFGKGDDLTIAVYDLGGGTFDVSLVKISADGTFDVIATMGDSYLGGEDFDRRLTEWLVRGFEAEHGIDLRQSPEALARLKEAAQRAKCELSDVSQVDVKLPFIAATDEGVPLHMDYNVTRETLEKLTSDLITRTLAICELAFHTAEIRANAVDEVILVGGMTRMPAVQFAVAEFFGTQPCKGVHPDEVVALGAAIQGAALSDVVTDVTLNDVTAHSLGVMTYGDGFDVLVHANTSLPVSVPADFTTSQDGQDTVKIVVLQGESTVASENTLLGQFTMADLRDAPAGEIDIEVTFRIDENGLLGVTARDRDTGEERQIEVTASTGLTRAEIQAMMEDSAGFLAERREEERFERVRQTGETVLAQIERLVPRARAQVSQVSRVSPELCADAERALERGKSWLEANDVEALALELDAFEALRVELERVLSSGL